MKKLLIFHSALAPYRIDFFNALADYYNCHIIFLSRNNRNQPFNQQELLKKARFNYSYMNIKLVIKNRDFNIGYLYHIIKFKPDIIIGGEYGLPVIMPYFYKKVFHKKYSIYTICDDSLKIAQECNGIRQKLRSFFASRLNGIIFISSEVSNWYKSHYKLNSSIIFPIIKEEKQYKRQLTKSLPISQNFQQKYGLFKKKVILYVGRITEVKNIETLIHAYSKIANEETTLVLVGDGNLKKKIEDDNQNLISSNQVILTGRYEGDELYAWYNLANLFVLPSQYEPFGAVTAEALQAGCPVLCSQNAGSSELIINDVNGRTFNPQDEMELSQLLKYYISNIQQNDLPQIRNSLLSCSFKEYVNKMIKSLQ